MTEQSDQDYYAARARVERALSDTATDPAIAIIHTQLADRYEALAAGLDSMPQLLRVVGGSEGASDRT